MTITEALTELGKQIRLPDLAVDENNTVGVSFDDRFTVVFEALSEGYSLRLSAVFAPLDDDNQEESHLERLLHANLLGLATGGAHFSVDEEASEILLERTLDMQDLDFADFSQAVESFINHLEGWQGELGQTAHEASFTLSSGSAMMRV